METRPVLQDCYQSLSEDDLSGLESRLKIRLPEEYRDHLKTRNGGHFPFEASTSRRLASTQFARIRVLYGVNTNDDSDIERANEQFREELPPGMLPIGFDGSGVDTVIATSGATRGAIFSWDKEAGTHRMLFASFQEYYESLCYDELTEAGWRESIQAFRAAERGSTEALDFEISSGIDLEAKNDLGETLLLCASRNGQSHAVEYLLGRGVNVNARDSSLRSALHGAALACSRDSAAHLIAAGAAVDAADIHGDTPLLLGVRRGERVPLCLIAAGAKLNARNEAGQTPLVACARHLARLKNVLREGGASN